MEKLFKLQERGSSVRKEVIGGITTFLAMAYILAVNPGMLAATGLPAGGVFTATAVAAAIATFVMAFAANLPIALAPGMGLNAFFTYTVCLGMGVSYQVALTAVLLEGAIFIVLSIFNVREAILNSIPATLKKAIAVGIGFFICFIGLQNSGIIVDGATLVGLGSLKSGAPLVAIIGLMLTAILFILKVPGSILIGLLATTVIGIPFGVTTIPEGFKPFSLPEAPVLFAFDFSTVFTWKFFMIFFTFFFGDLFDTIGTLVGITEEANLKDADGKIPRGKQALLADAIGTVVGACLGTSTVTSYVESSAGVAAGAKTGFASVITGLLFLLALFMGPIFLLVPSAATAPALIFVGYLMMKSVGEIDFKDPTEGIPAFITIFMMPFAYSIAEGIAWGIISYTIINACTGKVKKIPVITWILFVVFVLRLIFA